MSQIQQVKEATNIIEIITERVPLTRSGVNFRANCPFHSEKSPSFFVSEQLQRYRCFGCGASGDVIGFLEEYDRMTFAEALKYLAERVGITLQDFQRSSADDERDRLLEILNLSKEYFHYLLTEHSAGEKARAYLKQRHVSGQSVKIFQVGYAMPGWDGLVKYLHGKKKYSLVDIEKAGLAIQGKGGRYYDRFRDRVMFPLKNHRGQVLGFSGRTLSPDEKEAKYINSPETMLYHKSEMLFGLSELFQAIKQEKRVLVVEGEFDVISSAQAHVNAVVAIKGSALTEQQAKLLERYAEQVVLALDADEAGINATLKAIGVVAKHNLELRVIDFAAKERTGQKDPDEIARETPKLWRELSSKTVSVYEFLLQAALRKYDPTTPEGKRQIIDFLSPVFGGIAHAVEQDFYLQKLSSALNVRLDLVKKDIEKFRYGSGNKQKNAAPAIPSGTTQNTQPQKTDVNRESHRSQLERALVAACLANSEFRQNRVVQLRSVVLETVGAQEILKRLATVSSDLDLKIITKSWPSDLVSLVFDWILDPNSQMDVMNENQWQLLFGELKKVVTQGELGVLNQRIKQLDSKAQKTDEEELEMTQLLQKIVLLQTKSKI